MRIGKLVLTVFGAIAGTGLLAAASAAPAATVDSSAQVLVRVESALAAVGAMACNKNCEFDCDSAGEHRNSMHWGGNDGGEEHSCAASVNSCRDHTCSATQTQGLQELETLLPTLDGDMLKQLMRSHQNIALNMERHAVQVLGCQGQVALSLNLMDHQVSELVALGL